MRPADQFHVGIVVDDLDRALGELSARFGYRWADEIHVDQPVQLPHGTATVEFRFRYSRDAPRLEIIEARPGTLWVPARDSGIHHLGYWSDDVAASAATLLDNGYVSEVTRDLPNGLPQFAFLRGPSGIRIELVNRLTEPGLSGCWSTERNAS